MKSYIGIDLGTTNSAICSYGDGQIRIRKSPEQNDVTPSAIYIGKRGAKYVGTRAYNLAPKEPDNVAMLFKRFMGTSTPVKLPAVDVTMTPEECSAEILRTLLGYLPEEIRAALRSDPEMGTVITVPAAFNQMQKTATMEAAEQAGIGKVALMQEPVAAVMRVMKEQSTDGAFLIYDLGGGTLDVTLAESVGGHVNLLALAGIAMCGGRDFDRLLFSNVVKPWLCKTFDLPDDWSANSAYKSLLPMATLATERAKIELSSQEEATVNLSEADVRIQDRSGQEIYIDVKIDRSTFNRLIRENVSESIVAARETLEKAGYSPHDVERIVFVGGPTHYKPLRDQVSSELGIAASTEVNPMTAVAEGAALFAESIDWASQDRSQKSSCGTLTTTGALKLDFNYAARTPNEKAKITIQAESEVAPGMEYQIESLDTGWTSGRLPLKNGATIDVSLSKDGENRFKVSVLGSDRGTSNHEIVITRTAATVDAIPASDSTGLVVLDKLGGRPTMEWLVRQGDQLPKKTTGTVKAGESLRAGSSASLNFHLVEGESDLPQDNFPIGVLKISGTDLDDEAISAGADLEYNCEMLDSGEIVLKVSIPSIGFCKDQNFYSRQEGQVDLSTEYEIIREDGERTLQRLADMEGVIDDPRLEQAHKKLKESLALDGSGDTDPERVGKAREGVRKARQLVALVRKDNKKLIRQLDLDKARKSFNADSRLYARPSEETAFDALVGTAQRSIDRNDDDFESHLDELQHRDFTIVWRQGWYIINYFRWMTSLPHRFSDPVRFKELVARGKTCLQKDDTDGLRQVVMDLYQIWIRTDTSSEDDAMIMGMNIMRDTNIIRE